MLKNQKSLGIEYLGRDNIKISEYEKKVCNFYLIKNSKDTESYYTINNKDYFILQESKRVKEKRNILYEECEIVIFEDELIVNEEIFTCGKKKIVDVNIKEDFLYALALYYIANENRESGQEIISQLGDIYIYKLLENEFDIEEKKKIIDLLNLCISDRKSRFKEGKINIKNNLIINENECLIEILNEILSDDKSKLLWDYNYDYSRATSKNRMIEDNYVFIKPKVGYGEITEIIIGSKKLNICLKVKVEGEVKDKETNLKLDSHIFREYIIVLNGRLNQSYIWCKLSNELKSKYKKRKLIKSINNIYGEEIITLDLTKIEITNHKLLRSLDIETVAKYLYKIEELKIRQGILKNIIKDRYVNERDKDIITEIKKRYRVDEFGLYHPIGVVKSKGEEEFQIYSTKFFEWKIEKYPKKKLENEILKEYATILDNEVLKPVDSIYNEYKEIKEQKKKLEYKVNVVRISSAILNKEIFIWDKKYEKEKRETDKVLNINVVIGGKVKVFIKVINDINIRQDSYSTITRCD